MNRILVKDTYLSYEVYGKGKPILFLHGAYVSKREWKYQIDTFAENHEVILLDMPGHGDSDNLMVYSVELFADYVNEFIKVMKIKPCIICGHSLGGMVTQAVALNYPSAVEKIILADTSYGVKTNIVEFILTTLSMPIFKLMSVEKQAKLFADQLGKHDAKIKEYVYDDIKKHTKNPKNYKKIWDAVTNFNSKESLHKISCPTLILVGERNRQTHKQAKFMAKAIPYAELAFIKDANHMLNMDNIEDFNKEVSEFIK